MGALQAGVARTIVTPPLGIYLIGYADRSSGCKSVHDDLTATALVLDDGSRQLLLIALDMLVLNERIVARARAGIARQWGIPHEQVMICCSHTHSGPIAYAGRRSRRKNRHFIDGLVEKLVAIAGEAMAERRPATVAWARGKAHIAVNRRELLPDGTVIIGTNPEGAMDRSLNVVQMRTREGSSPLATLINMACHATVLGPSSYAVSADWPGAMRREVEAVIGGRCLFVQGATGNLNPDHEWSDDDVAVMEAFGGHVAGQVLDLVPNLRLVAGSPLLAETRTLWLPLVPQMAPGGRRRRTYRQVLAREAGVPRLLVDPILNARYPWKTTLEERDGRWHTPMEVQTFRMGECGLVAHSAEVFNEIGMAVKEGSPFPATLFAGYSNGCIGYLPTAEAHALGGYEVELAPYFYRLPGLLDPSCEQLAVDQSLESLHALWAGP